MALAWEEKQYNYIEELRRELRVSLTNLKKYIVQQVDKETESSYNN